MKQSLKKKLSLNRLFGSPSSVDKQDEVKGEGNRVEQLENRECQRWYLDEADLQLMSSAALLEQTLDENRRELLRIKSKAAKVPVDDVQYVQLGDAFLMKSVGAEERVEMWIGEQLKQDRSAEKTIQNVIEVVQSSLQKLNQTLAEKIRQKVLPVN